MRFVVLAIAGDASYINGMSVQSPAAELPDTRIRFRVRTLLLVTTVVAILLAVAAPYLREMTVTAWLNLATLWGSALLFGSLGFWYMSHRLRKFNATQPRRFLVKAAMKSRQSKFILYTFGFLIGMSFYAVWSASNNIWNFTTISFGLQAVAILPFALCESRFYFAIHDDGISTFYHHTPWKHIRGILQGAGTQVIGLKRLAGNFNFYAPPEQRDEILAYLEEQIGKSSPSEQRAALLDSMEEKKGRTFGD